MPIFLVQEVFQLVAQSFRRANLAFPDNETLPSLLRKESHVAVVAFHGGLEFLPPNFSVPGRGGGSRATWVPVPKTPVDEQHLSATGEDDVWPAREVVAVRAVAIL
jgi:hypothetical protein